MTTKLTLSVLTLSTLATAQWIQVTPVNAPSPRLESQMAFDSTNNQTVLFGGADLAGFPPTNFGDTWTWNGLDWAQQSPAASPPSRYFGGMAYDAARGVTVLYGGLTATFFGANYFDDTWEYDGTTNAWTQVTTANTPGGYLGNPGMGEVSMAYDLLGQRTVIFGGELFQGIVPAPAVTFEYDGINWTQVTTGTQPPRRSQASLCSAPTLGGVLLFGGTNFNNPPGPNGEIVWNDTWVYSSTNDLWTQLTPTGTLPPARAGASLLFDATNSVYVMHGGYDSTPTGTTPLADTWIFDGTTWTDVTAAFGNPGSPRVRFASADGPGDSDVLFGGGSAFFGPFNNDTWIQGCVASSNTYGAGCTGSNGVPSLTPTNDPVFGATFAIDVANLDTAAAFAFMSIGFSDTTSVFGPLPVDLQSFGLGAGCDLWTSADTSILFPVAGGIGTYNTPIPANPDFCRVTLYFQCASIDAGAVGGLAVSNAVSGTLGY